MNRIRIFAAAAAVVGMVTFGGSIAGASPAPPAPTRAARTAAAPKPPSRDQERAAREEVRKVKARIQTMVQQGADPNRIVIGCHGTLLYVFADNAPFYVSPSILCTLDMLWGWFG